MRLSAAETTRLGISALTAAGVPQSAAALQVDLLVEVELRGHPSHGLLRLPTSAGAVSSHLDSVRGSDRQEPRVPVVVPGDRARRRRAAALASGIELPDELHKRLRSLIAPEPVSTLAGVALRETGRT
jgi:LDH2 family malate/lactate/ureidoglycolate dehydrogenase